MSAQVNHVKNPFCSNLSKASLAQIEERLEEVDQRIDTWRKIAKKENIDIAEESGELASIMRQKQVSNCPLRAFNLLLIEQCKKRICTHIVRKVKRNLQREPDEQALAELKASLFALTNKKVIPWVTVALKEGVDIQEERIILDAADKSSYEQLLERGQNSNPRNILEVVQRRLLVLRLHCCMQVIRKTYCKRIRDLTSEAVSKDWFDDARKNIVEGIAADALAALPQTENLSALEHGCEKVYQLFKDNLELFEKEPDKWKQLADREWLRREILSAASKLLGACKRENDILNAREVCAARDLALKMLDTNKDTAEIREIVQKAYGVYYERIFAGAKFGGCGLAGDHGSLHSNDRDPSA